MSENTPLIASPAAPAPTNNWLHVLRLTLKSSPVNYFLLFVPLGYLAEWLSFRASLVFSFNFVAIIPLASVLAYATEELGESIHNDSIAGLLNATFGNAVEVIVSVLALSQNQITVVQASMLGSILSNLLLVLGCCFIAGGIKYPQQSFNQTVAQTMSSLLALSMSGLLLPAAFHASLPGKTENLDSKILEISRGTSILLLIVYCFYLYFQLGTHKFLFDQALEAEDEEQLPVVQEQNGTSADVSDSHSKRSFLTSRPRSLYELGNQQPTHLAAPSSLVVLLLTTLLVSFSADYLVSSIDDIVESSGLSKTFIGLIVIPIVGNAAEHVTAVVVAVKNKMDLAVGVAVGSSIQISLFVTPFLVLIGWVFDVPMSLYFSTFETAVMFVAVLITNYLILDGESNWLEGVMLVSTYVIIAISFFFYPDTIAT
ncbi:hypothetical protein OGAPHI_005063 [Ogataea philodendri]|uniref:Vacuolar calcium ion transporter n=1 Tax=Ogataea philodendri TaxID=1378263 RepID=A0A9P8P1T6_9ASCO|nr:uncharacterized protein OGAPHI_005063 [Ogataea philodendri]KAH3663662.1 hypothetical protein OGAPHI_005063 [Ogataea philodendri]